jgi:hypothetical protein
VKDLQSPMLGPFWDDRVCAGRAVLPVGYQMVAGQAPAISPRTRSSMATTVAWAAGLRSYRP